MFYSIDENENDCRDYIGSLDGKMKPGQNEQSSMQVLMGFYFVNEKRLSFPKVVSIIRIMAIKLLTSVYMYWANKAGVLI